MDIIIKDLSGKVKMAATSEKGRVLGIFSGPYSGSLTIHMDTEAMANFRKPVNECKDLPCVIRETYIEFFPERGNYSVQINF